MQATTTALAATTTRTLATSKRRLVVQATLVRSASEALAEWQGIIDAHGLTIASLATPTLAIADK